MEVSALCVLTVSPFICMNISPLFVREINSIKIKVCPCTNVAKMEAAAAQELST